MTNKKYELSKIEENDSKKIRIADGCIVIPLVLKIHLSIIYRTTLILATGYGLTYLADFQSPIYAICLTIALAIIDIIFSN
jgi:hypothetical protein